MLKHLVLALLLIAGPVAAQVYTTPAPLADNDGDGVVTISKAVTTPQAPKGSALVFKGCTAVGCTYWAKGYVAAAAQIRPRELAPPSKTAAPRDFGPSGQWTYASKPGVYGNVHAIRAMDMILIRNVAAGPRIIQDVTADSTRGFITTQAKRGANSPVNDVTVRRVDAASRKRGIYLRGGSHDWLIQDFRLRGIGVNTSHGDIPVGIGMNGAHHITIERGEVSGFKSEDGSRYPNADGISSERIDHDITLRAVYSHDNTDGCFDLKSTETRLEDLRAARCRYNYRLWGTGTATTLTSEDPKSAHVQMNAGANYHIALLIAKAAPDPEGKTPPAPIIIFNAPNATLVIDRCELSVPAGTVIVKGEGNVTLGRGCK